MLSVKQEGIKYHFLWYDMTWDWTLVSRAIGKHSTPPLNFSDLENNAILDSTFY